MKQAKQSNNVVNIKKAAKPSKASIKRAVQSAFEQLRDKADALHLQHDNYHQQYVVRGNAALYKLLGEILTVCAQVRADANREQIIQLLRKHLRNEHDIKTQKNSTEVSIIVRYIVRADRKTVHLYARAIQTALDTGVTQSTFESFVAERGGLEKIRHAEADHATKMANDLQQKCNSEAIAHALAARYKAPIATILTTPYPPLSSYTQFTLLLAVSEGGHNQPGLKIVGCAAPNPSVEKLVIADYAQMLFLSALDPNLPAFRDECKKLNIDEDVVLRWAAYNQFATHDDALKFGQATTKAADAQIAKLSNNDAKQLKSA